MCGEGGGESPVLVFLYLLFIFTPFKYNRGVKGTPTVISSGSLITFNR